MGFDPTTSKSKVFLIVCLAFMAGIALGRYLGWEIMAALAVIFIMLATLGWNNRLAKIAGAAGLIMVLGMARIHLSLAENQLRQFYGQTLQVAGVIVEEPDVRSDKTYLTIGRLEIAGASVEGKILATEDRFTDHRYGDRIVFTEPIGEPRDAEDRGEFSYKNYLAKSGIGAVVYYPEITIEDVGRGNVMKAGLLAFKQKFVGVIAEILPEPHNSFLAGLLVGLRRGIPQELMNQFNVTGVTHIIALSGFNITIIATFIDFILLYWFNRRMSFGLSVLVIAAFVIITGAQASVVRAAVMGILGMLALNMGRIKAITNAMVFTGAVMVAINPLILHFDVGFQLSFLALMGLVYLSPLIEPGFRWLWKYPRQFLVATLSAQLFVLPVVLLNFDRLSLVAPLTNVLVLPVIPAAMLFGFLAGLLGLVWLPLALPLAWMTWVVLEYIIKMVELTARLPLASVEYENFGLIFLIIYYLILTAILWKTRRKELVYI